jgi:hypothetical protein
MIEGISLRVMTASNVSSSAGNIKYAQESKESNLSNATWLSKSKARPIGLSDIKDPTFSRQSAHI